MYKAVIIDDEEMARTLLYGMLSEYCPEISVSAMCKDLHSGVIEIRKTKPDIIFLDIEMPGQSGLEILEYFDPQEVDFSIVFVTAYDRYAIQAFKLSAVDYLLKPIETDDLKKAIELIGNRKNKQNIQVLKDNMKSTPSKVAVNTINSIIFINLEDILFMKADGSYTEIFTKDNQNIISSKSLKHFENVLVDVSNFIRCHKSFIVNMNYINKLIKSDGGSLEVGKHRIGISPDKIATVLQKLSN